MKCSRGCSRSMTWLFSFPITIEEGEDPNYPLKLTNINTNVSINARSKRRPMNQRLRKILITPISAHFCLSASKAELDSLEFSFLVAFA